MGCLGIPTRINKGTKYNSEEKIYYKCSNYSNSDAVANLIHYITRTRANETRANDLITYGAVGAGFLLGPEVMIHQFCYVQNAYKINQRKGKRMYHEVLNLYDCEAARLAYLPEQFWAVGMECSQIYYQMGFQAAFAVHWEQGKRYHIHFAGNGILHYLKNSV